MKVIPLRAIPNQRLNIVLGNQNCTLHIAQKGDYMYADLAVNGIPVREGAICLVDTNLRQYPLAGFSGLLYFVDMKGLGGVPEYSQLGTRYILLYEDGADVRNTDDQA